jgi:hypothetical protein
MTNDELTNFFKEFIESKNFKKLKSVNQILYSPGIISDDWSVSLDGLINFLRSSHTQRFMVNVNVTIKDKRAEYILNQQYTIKVDELISYYTKWSRDSKLQNILV